MKKCISVILIIIMSLVLFAGCGSENVQEKDTDTSEKVELDVWICYDRNVPGSYYVFLWDSLAEEYGYSIDIKTYSQQEIKTKLRMAMACNELPDIFYVPGGSYPEYLFAAGACIPVQRYLRDADFKEEYVIPYDDGNNYVIPCFPESYAVAYYDTELMELMGLEVPGTWEELVDMVEQVNAYNQANGTSYSAIGLGEKDNWMGNLLYCMIAERIDPEAYHSLESETMDLSSDVFSGAAGYIQQLIDMGAFPKGYMEIGEPEAVKKFINHESVMMVHQSSLIYHLIQNMGAGGFQLQAFPSCNSAYDDMYQFYLMELNHTYTPGLAISSRSEYKEEAAGLCLDFAEMVNRTNVEEYGYLNISNTAYSYEKPLKDNVQRIHDMMDQEVQTDVFPDALLSQETGDKWGNAVKKLFAGELDVQKFMEESKSLVNK